MSQENVDMFKRIVDAYVRRDTEALLQEVDAEIELHPALLSTLGGEATVYRGHAGVREWLRDTDDAFATREVEIHEIRDLGERLVASGGTRLRGKASGIAAESPLSWLVDFKNGKVVQLRSYLGADDALEAAGLRE